MDPILTVRTSFLAGIGAGLLFDAIPYFRTRFVAYGSRSKTLATARSPLSVIDKLAAYPVPHSWFLHYYILSVSLSLFWGLQLFTRGAIMQTIASWAHQPIEQSMTLDRIWLAWALLLAQGYRRLHESITLAKPTNSTMPLAIYLVGLVFYILDSFAVWIEGSATINLTKPLSWMELLNKMRFGWTPDVRVLLVLPVFIIASGLQNDIHRYLASLKKYTLPQHPLFSSVVSPHYSMECIIYLALSIISAPPGQLVNKTIFTTFLFTAVNLGLAAKGTKQWSIEKFGKEVEPKWRMIPYIW